MSLVLLEVHPSELSLSCAVKKYFIYHKQYLTLSHSEWPKLHRVLAVLSAKGLTQQGSVNIVNS